MNSLDNHKITKILQTSKGPVNSLHSYPDTIFQLCIFNQILSPSASKIKTNIPIDLQHLNYHKSYPFSIENTSIAWVSFEHEIRQILSKNNLNSNQIILFQSSNYQDKIPQIFNQFTIVKAYNYRLKIDSLHNLSQDKITLINQDHVLKQIELQFSLGNGSFKPGYIGEIKYEEIESPVYKGIIKAYLAFSSKSRCPIVVNFASEEQETYQVLLKGNQKCVIEVFEKKLNVLNELLTAAKQKNCSQKIIVYNLPLVFVYDLDFNNMNRGTNYFQKHIDQIVSSFNLTLGFKLLRYSKFNQKDAIDEITKIISKYPHNVILSSGIQFKTDLRFNSGQGFSLYEFKTANANKPVNVMNSIQYMRVFLSKQTLDQVSRINVLKICDWKQKKEEVKLEILWSCDSCKKDFSKSSKKYSKLGRQFCSLQCLSVYKF